MERRTSPHLAINMYRSIVVLVGQINALSALADRIKIARCYPQEPAQSRDHPNHPSLVQSCQDDIHLSIQFVLNCGADVAGSCLGGSATGTYEFIHQIGYIPYTGSTRVLLYTLRTTYCMNIPELVPYITGTTSTGIVE